MKSRKPNDPSEQWVWRISQSAPLGEWVDLRAPPPPPKPRPELPETETGGWVMSSFDLLRGTDIAEGPDTLPMEYFDELFPDASKKRG